MTKTKQPYWDGSYNKPIKREEIAGEVEALFDSLQNVKFKVLSTRHVEIWRCVCGAMHLCFLGSRGIAGRERECSVCGRKLCMKCYGSGNNFDRMGERVACDECGGTGMGKPYDRVAIREAREKQEKKVAAAKRQLEAAKRKLEKMPTGDER